jgi:hypothetical protein
MVKIFSCCDNKGKKQEKSDYIPASAVFPISLKQRLRLPEGALIVVSLY